MYKYFYVCFIYIFTGIYLQILTLSINLKDRKFLMWQKNSLKNLVDVTVAKQSSMSDDILLH